MHYCKGMLNQNSSIECKKEVIFFFHNDFVWLQPNYYKWSYKLWQFWYILWKITTIEHKNDYCWNETQPILMTAANLKVEILLFYCWITTSTAWSEMNVRKNWRLNLKINCRIHLHVWSNYIHTHTHVKKHEQTVKSAFKVE